jgi:PAS domain S-box-containing protein
MRDSEVATRAHRRRRDDAPEAVALAAAALRAAALVRFSPDPVIGFTTDGVITEWNPAAERMYGHTAEQALGQSVDIIVPPELSADGLFARVRAGETIGGLDTQSVTRAGERIDVSISMSPITDDDGEAIGVAGFTRDIGVRVLADERLRRSEMLLTEAQELTSIGSWEWDLITGEVFWSPELFRILGLDPGLVVPCFDAYVECIHPDDRPAAQRDFAMVASTGTATRRTSRILGGDGMLRITQSRTRATTDSEGRVVRLNGTTQDVSEVVHANKRLERANRRNEALLNSAGDGIYGIDRDGVTTFANPVAARLTGHAVEHLVGRSRHDTFRHTRQDGTAYAERDCPVSASLADGTVHRCDADVYWRKDGSSFPVEYTSTPIFEQDVVVGAVVVFKDITERRDLEHAKDAFVASISHELRTPLTSIRGYLELFADEASGPLTEQQRRFLAVVDRNADRLLRVVGNLLLVAQVDAGAIGLELDEVDAAALIHHGVEVAAPLATANGLDLVAEVSATPLLRGDRARLGQVVDNLVSNAIKFTPAGGQVALRCFAVEDRVVLEVADTGLGMSDHEQEQLFERFYRTAAADEHAIQGTGLGLTIVKAFVEAHDGVVSVTSAIGAGTTFRVELPLAGPVRRSVT